ncbi:MAG: hypothetical protein JXA67_22575 [Micromonosporaceae bacterium]|nr:hypothetical protein [Micromonosporaceae bacterium]
MVGGVAHPVDPPVRERRDDHPEELGGQVDRAGGALASPEAKQHRQAHRGGAERQAHDDPGDHPPVTPTDLVPALGGPVMGPERADRPYDPSGGTGCRRPPPLFLAFLAFLALPALPVWPVWLV